MKEPGFWENAHALNPINAADAMEDPDNDGFTNLEEFKGGTSPQIAAEFPVRPIVVEAFPHKDQGIVEGTLRVSYDTTIVVRVKDDEAINTETVQVDVTVNSINVEGTLELKQVN